MLKEIIILVLIIFLVSRVVRFLLPVFRITSAANDHVRRMQQQMSEMQNRMNQSEGYQNPPVQKSSAKKSGDYIDYEEVK